MSTTSHGHCQLVTERDRALSIFGEVMGLVAITCLFAAAGAYVGKDLTGLTVLVPWLVALGCIFGLNVANARGNRQLALVLLFAFGLLLGVAVGNMLNYYATTNPSALYQAAAATGPVRRGARRGRLRDPARPVGALPARVLAAARADRLRDRD